MDDFSNLLMELGISMAEPEITPIPLNIPRSKQKTSESTEPREPIETIESIASIPPEEEEERVEEEVVEDNNEEHQESSILSDNDIDDILGAFDLPTESSEEDEDEEDDDEDYEDEEDMDEWNGDASEEYDQNIQQEEESTPQERMEAVLQSLDEETTSSTPAAPIDHSYIPLNSPTLTMDQSTSRFSGAEWYNEIQSKRIIFAGMGGIGSNAAFQIARMAPACIVLYDDDRVETVNMSGQLFSRNDIGKNKVDAVTDMLQIYTSTQQLYGIAEKFTNHSEAGDIMMCGFDNMKARKLFFDKWVDYVNSLPNDTRKKCLFLDGRLSMTDLQVFCITGDDTFSIHRYNHDYLFDDSEADETICSMKQTTYLACMIASVMTNLFTNWVANSLDPVIPYDLPFLTEYDAQNMIFKTQN